MAKPETLFPPVAPIDGESEREHALRVLTHCATIIGALIPDVARELDNKPRSPGDGIACSTAYHVIISTQHAILQNARLLNGEFYLASMMRVQERTARLLPALAAATTSTLDGTDLLQPTPLDESGNDTGKRPPAD